MSTALFSLMIFFCITGITLNHLDWVSQSKEPEVWQDQIPAEVLEDFKQPISESLLDWLSAQHSLATPTNIEWDEETKEVMLDYAHPAGFAFVIVDSTTGNYSIDYQKGSIWLIANDLHKGRHAGAVWSWLLDLSAVFMVLFSVTGLILLWQNRPKRKLGIVLTLAGTLTPILLFFVFVPNVTGV